MNLVLASGVRLVRDYVGCGRRLSVARLAARYFQCSYARGNAAISPKEAWRSHSTIKINLLFYSTPYSRSPEMLLDHGFDGDPVLPDFDHLRTSAAT